MVSGMTPEEYRVLGAAEKMTSRGKFTYDRPRGDDTPQPTCVGCGASSWGEIRHARDCNVQELIDAVLALRSDRHI